LVKCAKNASSFHIIPPIVSAKLTTKNHLFFRYGELEVIAKLPTGDWIVSGKHDKYPKNTCANLMNNIKKC